MPLDTRHNTVRKPQRHDPDCPEPYEARIAPDFRERWPDTAEIRLRDLRLNGPVARRSHWADWGLDTIGYGGPTFNRALMASNIVQSMQDAGAVGFSWAIVQNGRLVDSGGLGDARTASESSPREMDANTRMVSASLAKPVCAIAVMKLIEDGSLSLNEAAYPHMQAALPGADSSFSSVTIRHLLTHRAGFQGPSTHSGFPGLLQNTFAPLGNSSYHNANYWSLAYVVEGVTGESFVDFAKRTVLEPSGITGMNREVDDSAPCLYYDADTVTNGDTWDDFSVTQIGAYGWFASAIHWARLMAYFRYDRQINQSSRLTMLDAPETYFGFRHWNGEARGSYYGHGGDFSMGGGQAYHGGMMGFPDGVDAVLLTNSDDVANPENVLINAYESAYD